MRDLREILDSVTIGKGHTERLMTEVHRIRLFDYIPSPISCISIDKKENILLVGRESGFIELWNITQSVVIMGSFRATESDDLHRVAWCKFRNEPSIVVTTNSGDLLIYDYKTLQLMAKTQSFGDQIWGIAVNDAQTKIAIACSDSAIRVFSTETDLQIILESDKFSSKALCVCFDTEDNIYGGDNSGQIAQIDQETGRFLTSLKIPGSESNDVSVWTLCSTDDGIASGDSTGAVLIWDIATATIKEEFHKHQADVTSLVFHDKKIWAAGFDPTVISFQHTNRGWSQAEHRRVHTHDIVSIVGSSKGVITASKDSCVCIAHKLILPIQNRPPVASSKMGDDLIVVGGVGRSLHAWRLNSKMAKHELNLKTAEDEDVVEVVAISPDGKQIAYSASATRTITYSEEHNQWILDGNAETPSSSLCYGADGTLYFGSLDGRLSSSNGQSIDLGFPIFKIAVSTNGKYVCAGGLGQIVSLPSDLSSMQEIPKFATPFSTFEFQPKSNRLFIATGAMNINIFNVQQNVIIQQKLSRDKQRSVSPNTLRFNPNNSDQLLIASSHLALVTKVKGQRGNFYKLPYKNSILFVDYVSEDQIVIFEKPWAFMVSNLPLPLRMKRFQSYNERRSTRY